MRKGEYAELIVEIVNRIYLNEFNEIKRNYRCKFKSGITQEIDVCVFLKNGNKVAFEVRDRNSKNGKQGSEWINEVYGKYQDEDFEQVWVCTFGKCNLAKTAIKAVDYRKIGWRNININGDYASSKRPVVIVNAIRILTDEIMLNMNGENYSDLKVGIKNNIGEIVEIDVKQQAIANVRKTIISDFENLAKKSCIEAIMKIPLENIKNNLNKGDDILKIFIPIEHITFLDYIDKDLEIKDYGKDNEENMLLTTAKNSIFFTNKTLVINLRYIASFMDEYTIANKEIIDIRQIPDKYKNNEIKQFKVININGGEENIGIENIIGVKL